MIYMLNLGYDASQIGGLFLDDSGAETVPALSTSKRWLKADPGPNWSYSGDFDPRNYGWTRAVDGNKTDAKFGLSRSQNPMILVRLWSVDAPASNLKIRFSAVFGRMNEAMVMNSPFVMDHGTGLGTMVAQCVIPSEPTFDGPKADGSFCWALGPIRTGPSNPGGLDQYEFVVVATLAVNGAVTGTFGHDPEMDVAS